MTYRRSPEVPEQERRDRARAEFAALAARGAAESSLQETKRHQEESDDGYAHLRDAIAADDGAIIGWMVVLVLVGGGGGVAVVSLVASVPLQIAGGVIAVATTLTGIFLRYPLGRRAVRRELVWLKSFAFAVEGYEEVLRVEPLSTCTVRVVVRFRDERGVPDAATLGAVLVRVNGLGLKVGKGRAQWESPSIDVSGDDGPSTNAAVRRWMRRVILEVIAPMHEGYPILEARFKRRE